MKRPFSTNPSAGPSPPVYYRQEDEEMHQLEVRFLLLHQNQPFILTVITFTISITFLPYIHQNTTHYILGH